jgi:hypothetical protein
VCPTHDAESDPMGEERLGPFPTPCPAGEQGALEDPLANAICEVQLAGAYRFARSWDVPTRMTPHYILCIGISGEAQVTVGSSRHLLARQTLVLTPPHVP